MKEERQVDPFVFCTEVRLVVLTGRKASNAEQLLEHLTEVSGASVFYHTHYLYLVHHYEKPRSYNDFANWVSQALQEQRLAERLAAIDLLGMKLREMRESLVAVLHRHVQDDGYRQRYCPSGDEFHFCEAKSFVMTTGLVAANVQEFLQALSLVSPACLHFHFFEARLRNADHPTNDFSQWLRSRGEDRLANRIDRLNPYTMTLRELQQEIIRLGRSHIRR